MVASAVAASCLLLSACGTSAKHVATSTDTTLPTPSASPSPNATDAARTKLLTAYQGFWNIQVQAYSTGSLQGLPVNTYALGPAFYDIEQTLQYYNSQNLVMRGRPQLSPQVVAISLAKQPFTATINDCIDTTNFLPYDKSTGKPAPLTDQVFRHPWTFTASFDNVQWRITDGKINRNKTC